MFKRMSLPIRSAGYSDAGNPSQEAELKAHYLRARRHPAASASSGVQNHRLPPPLSILMRA